MARKATSKVLVVDDEETLTWSMTKTLAKDTGKYELIIANTGADALQILKKGPIDVVVTDIRMPDLDGLDLLSFVREKYPSTKVIIMTAYGSPEVQKEATKRGSYYYLEKPFEISDIRTLILKALDEERRGGFVGQVVDLQLVDIIQMGCLGRFSMSLSVSQGNEEGLIYFKNGDITHAELGDLEGKDALYTMLAWNEGRFNSQMGISPPKETITDQWEHLLLEGMRRLDESVAEERDSTVLLQEVEKAFEDLDKEAAIKELLVNLLRILANIEGFQKGIWVDTKGNVLTRDKQTFTESETTIPLLMFTIASRIGNSLGNAQPLRVTLGHKNSQTTIMRYHHLFLMVILQDRTTADEFFTAARNILEKRLSKVSIEQSKERG